MNLLMISIICVAQEIDNFNFFGYYILYVESGYFSWELRDILAECYCVYWVRVRVCCVLWCFSNNVSTIEH